MLRDSLREIVDTMPTEAHAAEIERLRKATGHTINIVESVCPVERYTCAVHAFDLVEHPTYAAVATFGLGRTFAGAEFISFLLSNSLLAEIVENQAAAGDFVLYFEGPAFQHVGRLAVPGRVLSKWGKGLLYEHAIMEVPTDYGDTCRFYKSTTAEQSLNLFLRYAESRGFSFGARGT